MNINPLFVEQLATEAFWHFVFENGMQNAVFITSKSTIPKEMWSKNIAKKKLIQLGHIEEDLIDEVYNLVAGIITYHAKEEKNIIGTIYVEDFEECKEKDFPYTNLLNQLTNDTDIRCNYGLKIKGNFSYSGTLLLRTPFPSGVLLREVPSHANFNLLIPNTNTALGFNKTMVLAAQSSNILPSNPYGYRVFVSGIFHIPTSEPANQVWSKIIPNSICFLKKSSFRDQKNIENSIIIECKDNKKVNDF